MATASSASSASFDADDLWIADATRRYAVSRDIAQRDEIQERADWLAVRCVRRFSDAGEPVDDLVQVARLGLFKAIERFDPDMGVPFGAFATPTIMGELRRHFRDHTWSVYVPRRAKDLRQSVVAAAQELTGQLGQAPTVAQIGAHLGVKQEAVIEALDAHNAYRSASLDPQRVGHNTETPDAYEEVLDRKVVGQLLDRLTPRERRVVELRFFDELSQQKIAETIGTSQVHVGRILSSSLSKLRALATADAADWAD